MLYPHLRDCLGLLLSAVVLAGGIVPPGIRHAHPGASRDHHHHEDADHGLPGQLSDRRHRDHDDHHHRHRPHSDHSGLPGRTSHIHLAWFGFDLTFPQPDDPAGGRDDRPDEGAVPVRLVDDRLVGPEHPPWGDASLTSIYRRTFADGLTPVRIASLPPPVTSPPLCDTARHKRSGAQLT